MSDYKGSYIAIVVCLLSILEDICKYLGVKLILQLDYIKNERI